MNNSTGSNTHLRTVMSWLQRRRILLLSLCWILLLTLFTPGGGGTLCPPVMYLRITVQIHVWACWKKTFPNYKFGKGQYAFYPMKLSRFCEKKSSSEIPKYHKAGPLQTGSNASRPTKKIKSRTLFWRVLDIQVSRILLNMVNYSTSSHLQKELDPKPHPTPRGL